MRRDVDVLALHQKSGTMVPQFILWDEDRFYEIQEVKNVYQKAPKMTVVFSCIVSGREVHLYLDNKNRFYVETA